MRLLSSFLAAASLACLASVCFASPPASATPYSSDVVVARTGRTAILMWDAYRFLKDRSATSGSGAEAERAIDVAALDELVAKLPVLSRSRTIRLVVLVRKPVDGDNLIYKDTTFTDTTTLLTMEADRAVAAARHAAWSRALAAGKATPGLTIQWEHHLTT